MKIPDAVLSRFAVAGTLGFALVLIPPLAADAAEIKLISSVGMRAALEDLKPQFERMTPHKLTIEYGSSAQLNRRIESGAAFDVVVLTPALIESLVTLGKVAPGTSSNVAKVGIGAAIRAGTPRPDIATTETLKRTLLNAKSVVYSKEGQSGIYMAQLIERLGIAAEMKPRILEATRFGRGTAAVAAGEAELGFQLISEILPVAGAELVGPLPPELQNYVIFTAGISPNAGDAEAAKALIKFLLSPSALPVLKAKGMEPG